jgi:hypothetical protein
MFVLGRQWTAAVLPAWVRLRTRRAARLRDIGHARKEWEIRRLEEIYARATDSHEIERMERDWERRDGGGLRDWR